MSVTNKVTLTYVAEGDARIPAFHFSYLPGAPSGSSNPVTLAPVNETSLTNKVTLTYVAEREGGAHIPAFHISHPPG
jgi:hypothetical protein